MKWFVLYLVPTRLKTTNQLSTNQLSNAVNPVNHKHRNGLYYFSLYI